MTASAPSCCAPHWTALRPRRPSTPRAVTSCPTSTQRSPKGCSSPSPAGDVVFRHQLVRAAVIHQASASQRREAHAHLARLYDDELMRRATHLSAAATGPDQAVADLLDRASHLSIRLGGSAIAVDWLRRAAELCTDPARRERLRADAAFVASQASRFDDARRLADDPLAEAESAASVLAAAYVALYRDGDVLTTHRQLLGALAGADTLDDATVNRLVKLLLAVALYHGDPERWKETDDVVDRLASRLDADAMLFRDSLGGRLPSRTHRPPTARRAARTAGAARTVGRHAVGGRRLLRGRTGRLPRSSRVVVSPRVRPRRDHQRDDDAAPATARSTRDG